MKTKMLFTVPRFIWLVLVLAALPVCADDTNFVGAEWSLVDPQKVMVAAAEITPEKYANCDSAIVEEKSVRDYHTDGTGECQDETFTKVLTEKGKRGNRELSFFFMLPYWTVEVAKLEVIQPDGKTIPVDVAANSKESIDDSQMAMNIYDPNDRILRVNIPQLDVGDVVHVVARQAIHRSIMPDEFDDENIFEGTSYIRHWSYEVHAPTNLPLQSIGLRDEVAGTISSSTQTNGGSVTYNWEIADVPRMFDEPDMPPYDQVLQRLFVSTVSTWQDVSKWYWNLSLPHLEMTTPEMKQTVADLITNQPTDLDKVKALFYYVSKNIRYMGLTPEKDRPGFEPHDVCITFDKKYGVCRDKAGLLVEMLRLAGFKAYPVLINIGAKRDPRVPQPDFDHAIVCVELTPGQYTLMDPTDENTRDLLPSYDCNRSYLVCKPEGETLRVSPVPPVNEHMLLVKTTGALDADGVLDATSEFSFEGVNDDAYRNAFAHLKPDEQKRFFEGRLKDAIPGIKLTSLKVTPENILNTSVPLHAELKYTASGLTANGGGKSIVSLPWIASELGVANRVLIGSVGLQKRKYPLDTEVTCGVREEMSLKLTGGFAAPLSIPKFSSVNDGGVAYDENVAFTNGLLDCSREFLLKTVEFSPAQYLQLKQTLKDKDYDRRKSLILGLKSKQIAEAMPNANHSAEPPVESNAKILTSQKTLVVQDAHTAIYRVKYSKLILTYDGKIRESEVKIPYNPACEEAKIIHAVVISKTGGRQEISPGEINAMDQGWNAAAKRYTGGKILVASLPGVEIGSTIDVEFEVTMHDKPYLSDFESFQFPDALDKKSFELTAPANLPIHKLVSGAKGIVEEQDKTANDIRTYDWRATNVEALPSEQQLPPEWNYDAGVDYFVGNVADYWKALNDAMLVHSKNSTNAAALARQLTASAKTKLDAVKTIRDFIAKNIREAGPSFTDLPLRELSDADTTLADGYGHAADRAILFYAMLSAAGFQPEFVMASGLPPVAGINNIAKSFPLPDDFQTPLVKISAGGDDYYLNDGDQYSQLGTTRFDGKLGVALAGQKLETIHAAKNCGDKTETDYAVTLSADGKARIKISKYFYGEDYNTTHKFFAELPPEERNHYFQEAVSRVTQGAQAVGGLTTQFDTYPGLEEFTVELDDYGVVDGKYLYFGLPFTPSFFTAAADQRSLPLFISERNEKVVRAEIELPAGFRPTDIAPKSEHFTAPGGSQVHVTETSAGGKCVVTDEFETVPGIIAPGNYPKLLNIQSELGQKSETTFLLERK
jgi:transglutaminase-like putative cysteine protease